LLYNDGHFAVEVFWVISGFIFFWKYSGGVHQRSVRPASFFVWRFSRLYPLHFATLIFVAVMQYVYALSHDTTFVYGHNDSLHFLMQLCLASNWLEGPETFNGPVWSISAEVVAYFCFFLLVRSVKPSIIMCTIVVAGTKFLMYRLFGQPSMVLSCIEFFFAGGIVQQCLMRLHRRDEVIAFWGSACVVLAILAGKYRGVEITQTSLLFLAAGIVAMFSLLDSVTRVNLTRFVPLGDLTYSSYLLHFPIQLAAVSLIDALGLQRTLFLSPVALLSFMLGTLALSWLVYRRFEMPAQNAIRAGWLSRRAAQPALL